jgi:VanZ family protein
MKKFISIVPRWFPALFVMLAIFIFSSQPGDNLPDFLDWDYFVKKTSHAIGYGLLAVSYFHMLKYGRKRYLLAWLLALLFSITDEFHQSFVPGRRMSIFDVLIFDNLGAIFALWLHSFYRSNPENEIHSA